MKNDLTELVFVLDKSGSMSGLEDDTIGGFNSMISKQKKQDGDTLVTTVLFDDKYELLHDRINLNEIHMMTDEDYCVGGSTSLLDAMGRTINSIGKSISKDCEDIHPSRVMVVIITDGMENSSCKFSYREIKKMVEHQKTKYSWEFIFLGANIDAIKTASHFGISEDKAVNFCSDNEGTRLNYDVVSSVVSEFREGRKIDSSWKKEIDIDYAKRSKKNNKNRTKNT
jgi:uncharacterized protein YegL